MKGNVKKKKKKKKKSNNKYDKRRDKSNIINAGQRFKNEKRLKIFAPYLCYKTKQG